MSPNHVSYQSYIFIRTHICISCRSVMLLQFTSPRGLYQPSSTKINYQPYFIPSGFQLPAAPLGAQHLQNQPNCSSTLLVAVTALSHNWAWMRKASILHQNAPSPVSTLAPFCSNCSAQWLAKKPQHSASVDATKFYQDGPDLLAICDLQWPFVNTAWHQISWW